MCSAGISKHILTNINQTNILMFLRVWKLYLNMACPWVPDRCPSRPKSLDQNVTR